jgi:plastocyanin
MKRLLLVLAPLGAALALGVTAAATAAPAVQTQSVALTVKSDTEHAKKGPDGKWHDAFLPAHFTVHPGARVTVTVTNYDSSIHTFTSPGLGLNRRIAAGTVSKPSLTTFAFTAPKAGTYAWFCRGNCDPFAMTHYGYMVGRVTVV